MTVTEKLKKATFKHIESELYSYHDTLKEIKNLRNDIMFCKESDDENIGGGRSSFSSSPTEQIGTRLATHKQLNELEKIVSAIESVFTGLTEESQKLIKLKYWTKPQLKTWDGIAAELHINRATAIRWRDSIVKEVSDKLGWR